METLRFVLVILAFAAVSAGAYLLWAYLVSGRYRAERQRLQRVVVELLSETGHSTTFLVVVQRDARAVEVRLPIEGRELKAFQERLADRLGQAFPYVQLSVVPLTESLAHLNGAVAVWGRTDGNVYVGRGGASMLPDKSAKRADALRRRPAADLQR